VIFNDAKNHAIKHLRQIQKKYSNLIRAFSGFFTGLRSDEVRPFCIHASERRNDAKEELGVWAESNGNLMM